MSLSRRRLEAADASRHATTRRFGAALENLGIDQVSCLLDRCDERVATVAARFVPYARTVRAFVPAHVIAAGPRA